MDEYEIGPEKFYFDIVLAMLPGAGMMAVVLGLIDVSTWEEGTYFHTQGKVRIASGVVSHILYLLLGIAILL